MPSNDNPDVTPDRPTDTPTDMQAPSARRRPDSGEAVPAAVRRRLEHPPSDRFAVPSFEPDVNGSLPRTLAGAALPSLAGAVLLVVLASPLAVSEPLVLVALLTGIVAGRGARLGGGGVVYRQRRRAIATGAVLLGIAAAQVAIWQLAIAEGGVLPLGDYVLAVFGPVAPLELIAGGAAAWATAQRLSIRRGGRNTDSGAQYHRVDYKAIVSNARRSLPSRQSVSEEVSSMLVNQIRRQGVLIVIVAIVAVIAVVGVVFRDRFGSNASELVVGDCFDLPGAAGLTVSNVQHHPCTEAHTGEVFAGFNHPAAKGDVFRGIETLRSFATDGCTAPFASYAGTSIDESELHVGFFRPTEEEWNDLNAVRETSMSVVA